MEVFQTAAVSVLLIATILLLATLLILARQIGLVLVRVGPATPKELADGAPIGLVVDDFSLVDLNGEEFVVAASERALVVFVSPRCEACNALAPGLKTLAGSAPQPTQIVALTCRNLTPADFDFAYQFAPLGIRYASDPGVCLRLGIESPPYAVLIENGAVRSKGVVNSLQHLESLYAIAALTDRYGQDSQNGHHHHHDGREDELILTQERGHDG